MKKSISSWQVAGFIFTSVLGTFMHFLYSLSGENRLVAVFSAVNESTWEHMKLIFYPMLFFALFERLFVKENGFWCIKAIGIMTGTFLIPVLFYTIGGAFGKTPDFVNIAIFFLSAFFAFVLEARLLEMDVSCYRGKTFAILIILLLAVMFAVFTFKTPELPIFLDPVSGSYGIM